MNQPPPIAVAARGNWTSRFGFILAATGSAVGLGSIWRFPYIVHMHGGAAFSLVYLLCIVLVGLPIMWAEIYIGKKTGKDPVGAFRALFGSSRFWPLVGGMGVLAGFLILSFYTVITGWVLHYLIVAVAGTLRGFPPDRVAEHMGNFLNSAPHQIGYHLGVTAAIGLIVAGGVQKGIERTNNLLMPALIGLMVVLMGYAMVRFNGAKALAFTFLDVDFSAMRKDSVLVALGHAFFTLSLGMGAMITYGSYMRDREHVMTSGTAIVAMDTIISFMSCLLIFPILFGFGQAVEGGPKLIFVILPPLFEKMTLGWPLSVLFFALLLFAALASAISLLEVVVAFLIDEDKFNRRRAVLVGCGASFLLGIPSALSFGALANFTWRGRTVFDWADYLSSNWMLVLGGLFIAVAAGWRLPERDLRAELTRRWPFLYRPFRFILRHITPLLVLLVILQTAGVIG